MANESLLATMLQVAVPLWQERLKTVPWADLMARIETSSQLLAEHGDKLLYLSEKKGETANLFNRTAEAIAVLSFVPGGVTLFGQTWSGEHADSSTPPT